MTRSCSTMLVLIMLSLLPAGIVRADSVPAEPVPVEVVPEETASAEMTAPAQPDMPPDEIQSDDRRDGTDIPPDPAESADMQPEQVGDDDPATTIEEFSLSDEPLIPETDEPADVPVLEKPAQNQDPAGELLPEAETGVPAGDESVAPQAETGLPASPAETIIVEGFGAIVAGDKAAARDAALADVRRMAVEQVAGVKSAYVSEVTAGIMTRDDVSTETAGIILDTRILAEGVHETDMYRVQAEVTVATDPLRAMMYRMAPQDRIIVFMDRTGFSVDHETIVLRLTRRLIEAGYKVIDSGTFKGDPSHELWQSFLRGDRQALPDVGLAWGCPALLEGSLRIDEPSAGSPVGISCRGVIDLRLVSTETGAVLSQICAGDAVTGFGKTPEKAASDLVERAAEHCVRSVGNAMIPSGLQPIRVRVRGLPGLAAYRNLVNAVQQCRFVRSVTHQETWNAYMTKFTINAEADATVIGRCFSSMDQITVTDITENEIEVNYDGK